MNTSKLSILVRTFNVESFIADCLTGILDQKTQFSFEIIVADDASTDSTLQIVESFSNQYPGLFHILSSKNNQGLVKNLLRALQAAKGEYIAICDGDDFWTDPNKIQRQIAFLESHPEFSCCSHRVMVKKEPVEKWEGPIPREIKSSYNTYDLLDACFPHSSSILFRRQVVCEIPPFFTDIYTDDWCITILNSLRGDIKMFPEAMSVYRFSPNGNWTSKKSSFHFENAIKLISYLKDYLPRKYRSTAQKYLLRNYLWCGTHSLLDGDVIKARHCLLKLLHLRTLFVLDRRQVMSFTIRCLFPSGYQKLKSLRDRVLKLQTQKTF